ncbi:MAG: hypothetical protein RL012_376 [Bacteroidota bacterium]|jgi:hypothetical protein
MDELGYLLKKDALGLSFLYVVTCVAWGSGSLYRHTGNGNSLPAAYRLC